MLKPMSHFTVLIALWGMLLPSPALAYIGPGAGLGAIALAAALGLGVLLLFVGLCWYPLKRFLKKGKSSTAGKTDAAQ